MASLLGSSDTARSLSHRETARGCPRTFALRNQDVPMDKRPGPSDHQQMPPPGRPPWMPYASSSCLSLTGGLYLVLLLK